MNINCKLMKILEEPVLFLRLASNNMEDYKKKFHHYPSSWFQLRQIGFSFDGSGSWHVTDSGISPTEDDQEFWRPKNSRFIYRIVPSTPDVFLVQALDGKLQPVCEIRSGEREPVWLDSNHNKNVHIENKAFDSDIED